MGSALTLSLLLIRVLGPQSFGEYSFLVNAAALSAVLLSLGFPDTLMRYVALLFAEDKVPQMRFLVRRLALARVVSYALGIALLAALHGAGQALRLPLVEQYWVAIAGLLAGQGAIEFTTSFAYARLQARSVAIARTVGQIVAVLFFAAMIFAGHTDVVTASVTTVVSYLVASLMLLLRGLGAVLTRGDEERTPLRPIAGFAVGVWAAALCNIGLAGQIDVLLLAALRHDAVQIALYSVATLVFLRLGTLLSGWAGTATSSFAEVHARRGGGASGRLLLVYLRLSILLALLVYPPVILLSDQITRRIFGAAYAPAAGSMEVFGAFWLVSSFLAAGIPLSFLVALGRQRQLLAIRATTGILNVVLDVILIPPFGALGAIMATGTANVIAHVSDFVFAARPVRAAFPWAFAVRVVAASLVGVSPSFVLRSHDLAGELVGTALYVVLYIAALAILRPLSAADVELAARLGPRFQRITQRLARRSAP